MPPNTVYVGRPSKWGNMYKVGDSFPFDEDNKMTQAEAVSLFEAEMQTKRTIGTLDDYLSPLRGKDLACWCKVGTPCHADVLLKFISEGDK
jgi:hypothetical protein